MILVQFYGFFCGKDGCGIQEYDVWVLSLPVALKILSPGVVLEDVLEDNFKGEEGNNFWRFGGAGWGWNGVDDAGGC